MLKNRAQIDITVCLRYDANNHTKENIMPDETKQEQPVEILNEEEVQARFDKSKEKAKKILEDRDKMDHFLERLEKKLEHIPVVGGILSEVPVLISLVKAFLGKRYLETVSYTHLTLPTN
jgi:Asp/Glu/hydantoin racemase